MHLPLLRLRLQVPQVHRYWVHCTVNFPRWPSRLPLQQPRLLRCLFLLPPPLDYHVCMHQQGAQSHWQQWQHQTGQRREGSMLPTQHPARAEILLLSGLAISSLERLCGNSVRTGDTRRHAEPRRVMTPTAFGCGMRLYGDQTTWRSRSLNCLFHSSSSLWRPARRAAFEPVRCSKFSSTSSAQLVQSSTSSSCSARFFALACAALALASA